MSEGVKIEGDLLYSFNWLEQNGQRYFKRALVRAANVIKEQARTNLSSALPAAENHNPKYNDVMADAIRNSRTEGDVITVHALGTPVSGSGTYRARFYEYGSKGNQRYQKSFRGVPLKKKRFLGTIPGLKFFSSAVTSTENQVYQTMEQVINEMIDTANK